MPPRFTGADEPCVNAGDAMPSGGTITVKADNVFVDENYARMHLKQRRDGSYASPWQTLTGMPPEVIGRIFEPFFTTKEMTKGTGLGLSTALTIIKSHGGFINVYSEQGKGTQFAVYFPALDAEEACRPQIVNANLPMGHGELILVVDDEAAIRQITASTLETFGYRVLTASDGTEALALFAENRNEISVVLTDMLMPFMDGPATIRALQRLDPEVRIIAASGLSNQRPGELNGVKTFLNKPYTAEKLLKALDEILDG
jgi:CheY-like chemotaxis protein